MELIDMTKMSSKGQVVIPGDIRQSLGLETGTKFVVWADKDTVILRKIERPSFKEVNKLFQSGSAYAKKVGLKKSNVSKIIKEVRNNK